MKINYSTNKPINYSTNKPCGSASECVGSGIWGWDLGFSKKYQVKTHTSTLRHLNIST